MMEHLSETSLGKENSELVNSMAEAKAPPAKLPRLEQNGSPLGRARLGSTGTKLAGVPYKPTSHLLKTCHKRGKTMCEGVWIHIRLSFCKNLQHEYNLLGSSLSNLK